jgi:hypothetical protein
MAINDRTEKMSKENKIFGIFIMPPGLAVGIALNY